ncbi:MAG: TonB-dependent receptor [Nitrospiraceae bacterium]|nr:MAG: TonB-dependent receptor [Nitrospiraceae bacterium]
MKHIFLPILTIVIIVVLFVFFIDVSEAAERCEPWVAKVVSVQGTVQVQRSGAVQWEPVKSNNKFCTGDMVRVQKKSRVAIALSNETILRLDQNTTITFNGIEKNKLSLIGILKGVAHFFSRIPHTLKLVTPFVNGTVEGTEFLVEVIDDQSIITVFEGKVKAANDAGNLTLTSGQSAIADAGQIPAYRAVVKPRDAVQWALYYPPVIHFSKSKLSGLSGTDWNEKVRQSIQYYREGDLTKAFQSIDEVPEDIGDHGFLNYRAMLLLSVGRVKEAQEDIERSLSLAPDNSDALSLKSIISVVQNDKEGALNFSQRAVKADADSATAQIALSYAEQANFNLNNALTSTQKAVELDPENSIAWARLSELWLSFGNLDKAFEAAKEAVKLSPGLAHTQSDLGFAYLTQVKTKKSMEAFNKAVELDQAAPLPRLGLGLAKIRQGMLKEGRQEIEIAASLDPNNSLIRSYLGKAYHEERRDKKASGQFTIAKELDPLDPTSFFYSAIRKQSINRPVEAMYDQQKSIALNNNRSVYRSKMLLDDDLAARSASLARIYNDLGFQQLALVEGWKSVNTDPGNYSAHRFLADSYSALPRHEIARVSELFQSQLLQPVNITPVQPQLAVSNLFILNGAGPGTLSFNEFNPIFNRNQTSLQVSAVAGNHDTYGHEATVSGIYDKISISAGNFLYTTEGFRENNDQETTLKNVFSQVNLSHNINIQFEFRSNETEQGDPELTFTEDFNPDLRDNENIDTLRLGANYTITPHTNILGSFIYQNSDIDLVETPGFFEAEDEYDFYVAEIRLLFKSQRIRTTGGIGYRNIDQTEVATFGGFSSKDKFEARFTNIYSYSHIDLSKEVSLTLGGSVDFLDGRDEDRNQFNPKFGLLWHPFSTTTIRAAVFRTLQKPGISRKDIEPTLEPTLVAGFNQFFLGGEGDREWRYGVGVDQKWTDKFHSGAEFSNRDIDAAILDTLSGSPILIHREWEEQLGRIYQYWTPYNWLALKAEYLFEKFERGSPGLFTGVEQFSKLTTHRIPIEGRYFHPSGFSAGIKATYVNQDGDFVVFIPMPPFFIAESGKDDFWVMDTSLRYRLPNRRGIISIEVKNLFNEEFNFQDTDPGNPRILPERFALFKFTLAL